MNKRISFGILTAVIALSACKDHSKPGKIYMPDMAYSRAYETYIMRDPSKFTMDESQKGGAVIYYNGAPVKGTMKRGEMLPYALPNDSAGYAMSASVKSPIGPITAAEMSETQRLFNINCAVCHGEKGTGNGPIAEKIGAVANLTLPNYVSMADGTMFHSITYGKNNMGSYASQLSRKQRWMIVQYIRTLQPKSAAADTTKKI